MTHTEESLMALAREWAGWLPLEFRSAIREVLAERDAMKREVELMAAHDGIQHLVERAEKAEAERDEARLQQKAWTDKWDHAISRAERAEAECERLRKDAERYAGVRQIFLRGRDFVSIKISGVRTSTDIDAAIDAAIKEQP